MSVTFAFAYKRHYYGVSCGSALSSSLPREMRIFSLTEEPTVVELEGPKE